MTLNEQPTQKEQRVFVMHGRDEDIRRSMFEFLRSLNMSPLEWDEAMQITGDGSTHRSRILEVAFSRAQAVIVLLSGDDLAMLQEHLWSDDDPDYERELTPQARPNILFEAGMAFGWNADRTILIEMEGIRPFSAIAVHHVIKLDNSAEKRKDLADRLRTAGCIVDTSGTEWLRTGDFGAGVDVDEFDESIGIDVSSNWLDYDLDQAETDILMTFAENRQARQNSSDIASQLDLSNEVVQYHIDKLVRRNLLQTTPKLALVPQLYFLTGLGWSYLVENDLIE